MNRSLIPALAAALPFLLGASVTARAQDSTHVATTHSMSAPIHRANWLSDAVPLSVGDLVTVFIDERTQASETVSDQARSNRGTSAALTAQINGDPTIKPTGLNATWNTASKDDGQASRTGDLVGDITVRVIGIDEAGRAEIQGTKNVIIDGRQQEITIHAWLRPQDILPPNIIYSNRLADAQITYHGTKHGPKMGIIGKVVSIIWPF